jgi:cystathionine beta-lyase/cystathionine gamma-synthase
MSAAERITTEAVLQPSRGAPDPVQEAKDYLDRLSVKAAAQRGLDARDAQALIRCVRVMIQRCERTKERADQLAEMVYGQPRGDR